MEPKQALAVMTNEVNSGMTVPLLGSIYLPILILMESSDTFLNQYRVNKI